MFLQEVLTVPQTGNPKIDAIAQASIVGLSLASVFLTAWRAQTNANAKKKTRARHAPAPAPRTKPQKQLDDLNGKG